MSMVGELSSFLSLQVKQTNYGLFISQSKYAKDLIKIFVLDSKKHTRTPMSMSFKLGHDPTGTSVDQTLYRSMTYSSLQLADPKESHLSIVRRIIRYVSGIVDYRILYSRESNLDLVGYSNIDWARNAVDRKSTSGGCSYVGSNLVLWMSKKQNSISLSTSKVEYIVIDSCCTQLLRMKQMLSDYGIK
ncbi:uncharacterized protein LOC111374597 [Olea europaea var. sylvestris]|uniref:uncharacterized protein LOC111374597 n=1 Tax=Olea europaea var. sylvestris TaxID=158386 RepID=UPI000C1D6C0C|nr:uncharacterized protein LOC111374597 [Olea europaea var. sylvestris]